MPASDAAADGSRAAEVPADPPLDPLPESIDGIYPGWGCVRGRFTTADGRPLLDAEVHWEAGELAGPPVHAGPDGTFVLDRTPLGSFEVKAWGRDPVTGAIIDGTASVRVPRAGETVEAVIVVEPHDTALIDLVPELQHGGLFLVPLGVSREPAPLPLRRLAPAVAPAPPGRYRVLYFDLVVCRASEALQSEIASWAVTEVELVPGRNRVVLDVQPVGRLRAAVSGPGRQPAAARVYLDPAEPCLDAFGVDIIVSRDGIGCIRVEDEPAEMLLLPGRWRLLAVPDDAGLARAEVEFEVRSGELTEVTAEVPAGRSATVRSGVDITGWQVTVRGPPGVGLRAVDASTVIVSGLMPGDEACVEALRDPWATAPDRAGVARVGPNSIEAFVEVGPTASVAGTVVDAPGEPAGVGVGLALFREDAGPWTATLGGLDVNDWGGDGFERGDWGGGWGAAPYEAWRSTDLEGRFEYPALPPGRWRLEVFGADPVDLDLDFGERAEVTVRLR